MRLFKRAHLAGRTAGPARATVPLAPRLRGVLVACAVTATLLLSTVGCSDAPNSSPRAEGAPHSSSKSATTTSPGEALKELGGIVGAVYDAKSGQLVLLGDPTLAEPPMEFEDLAVALKSARDGQEPEFSLDPADSSNPTGPKLKAKYYGLIEHTHFGQAMFEADWLLKEYSFGAHKDGSSQKPVKSSVPGYKSILALSFERPWRGASQSYTRFWITADRCSFKASGNSIFLDQLRMKVNTERMYQTAKGLESSGGKQDPSAEKFAAHFSEHFGEFAKEQPAFEQVRQLAKAMAIAKWMREHSVSFDEDMIDTLARPSFDTADIVPAFSAKEQRTRPVKGGTETREVRLYGGVDLGFDPTFVTDAALDKLDQEVKAYLAAQDAAPVFSIKYRGREYRAMVAPFSDSGVMAYRR